MAERKTPTAPGTGPGHMQHRIKSAASASEGDAAPPRQKRCAPPQRPHGASPQRFLADTAPPASPPAREARGPGDPVPAPAESILTLRVSASLLHHLEEKAQEEGVGLVVLATELLAEGLVLRAWKTLEQQAVRRPGHGNTRPQPHTAPGARGAYQGSRGPNSRRDRGNRRPDQRRGGNIMDDQATFLEYVRTQERKRR